MHANGKKIDYVLILLVALLGATILYALVTVYGPPWDLIVRYLNGKTLFNLFAYNINPPAAFAGEFSNNLLFYFEPYREPLSMPIFAFLDIFFTNPIIPYLLVVYLGFLFAIYKLGKELGIHNLIIFSAFVNSYVLFFLFFVNGGEALCMVFVLLALVYLFRKSPVSGLLLGLAVIAKYPAVILLPIVLLLGDRKKITTAVILELIPIVLWGAFDYFIYGIPFYSYFASLSASNITSGASAIYLSSVAAVIAYPLLFALAGLALLRIKKQRVKIKMDYTTKILASLIVLSSIGYFVTLPHNDPITQARYGYIFSIALLIPATMLLSTAAKKAAWVRYAAAILSIIVLGCCAYLILVQSSNWPTAYYNPLKTNTLYSQAGAELSTLGFNGCRFISNAWVPMIYDGYDSYSPFILYTNSSITPFIVHLSQAEGLNYTAYLTEQREYPIIAFKYIGVQNSFILNINQSEVAYSSANFTIYLPENAACYVGINLKRS